MLKAALCAFSYSVCDSYAANEVGRNGRPHVRSNTIDKHPIRTGLLVTVLGGLILAAILALVPSAWRAAVLAFGAVRAFAIGTVALPTWLLAFGAAALLIVPILARRRKGTVIVLEASLAPGFSALDSSQRAVLQALAKMDGGAMKPHQFAAILGKPRLVADEAIESLEQLKLVHIAYSVVGDPAVTLTPKGRSMAITERLVE